MIEQPWARDEILYFLKLMADPAYARQVWIEHNLPSRDGAACFAEAITYFFDDMSLDKREQIGVLLDNEEEWRSVKTLMANMDIVWDRVGGPFAPDEEYLDCKFWPNVVGAARFALNVFEKDTAV